MRSAEFVANGAILTRNEELNFMTSREIAELALWTAKAIQDTLAIDGRRLDDAGTDIIREYVQTDLKNWKRGEKITVGNSAALVKEILSRRSHETETFDEVINALTALYMKFPNFVEDQQRQREAEAKILAAVMPAIKV